MRTYLQFRWTFLTASLLAVVLFNSSADAIQFTYDFAITEYIPPTPSPDNSPSRIDLPIGTVIPITISWDGSLEGGAIQDSYVRYVPPYDYYDEIVNYGVRVSIPIPFWGETSDDVLTNFDVVNDGPDGDQIKIGGELLAGFWLNELSLTNSSGTALSSDLYPGRVRSRLNPSSWSSGTFSLSDERAGFAVVRGVLRVPDSGSTVAFLGLALAGLAAVRRRFV